jgi:MFS family permease
VRIVGFGLHAVSNNLDAAAHAAFVADAVAWSVATAAAHRLPLRVVNVGGGLGVDYTGDATVDLAALGAGLALLALTSSVPAYLAAMLVYGAGSSLLDVAPAAVMGDVVGGRGGPVVAAFGMAGDAGSVGGPVVAGRLADTVGYGAAFGTAAGVLGLAAALAATAPETLRRKPATVAA